MAKEAYYWRGKGGLKIDRLYATGEKIPHTKMDKGTLAKLIESGEIKTAPFDSVESSTYVSELEKKVKVLSAELAEKNKEKPVDCEDCKKAADKIAELEGLLETATADSEADDEKKD
jgi:hypothetical protein